MRKYATAIETALDACWPAHPTVYFLSDCDLPGIRSHTKIVDAVDWTAILLEGLMTVRREHPQLDYVFMVLDDHCPLRPCDTAAISAYLDIARARDLAAIAFPTYDWPWERTENLEYPDGLVRTWRCIEVELIEGRRMAVVPRDFFRYFQIQPAFWKIDYLIAACRAALADRITDPWRFEALRWVEAAPHYVAGYDWPSVHHGFIAQGKVNPAAIAYMSRTAAAELHQQLIRDSIGIYSPSLYAACRIAARIRTRFGSLPGTLARRLQSALS